MQNIKDFFQGASNSIASNVSAPVDGIAWLLRKAGVPVPPNPMGGSDWMTEKGLTPQPQNRTAGLLGEFAGMAGPMVAAAKAPQLAKGLLQAGENLAAPRTLNPQTGAVVWHGSPHKFDKFDSAKIGTGEGAQAYGHGLYLADNQKVAQQYKDMLSPGEYRLKGGGQYDPSNPGHIAGAVLDEYGGDTAKAIKGLSEKITQNKQIRGGEQWNKDLTNQLNTIKAGRAAQLETHVDGSLYKVDLPDEQIAKMLDWDKPLSQQAPGVQKALGYEVGVTRESLDQAADGLLAKYGPPDKRTPSQQSAFTGEYQALNDKLDRLPPNLTGANFYNGTSPEDYLHQMLSGSSQAEMSAHLRSKGIPGIRYLDGGSRATGGTSNYVVFPGNESMLNILERNGKGLLQMGENAAMPPTLNNQFGGVKISNHSPEQMATWAAEKKARESQQAAQRAADSIADSARVERRLQNLPNEGMGQKFNSEQLDSIASYVRSGDKAGAHAEGRSQTVNAIRSELERLGYPIEKISQKDGGNSIYANINGSTVRVSDHSLPMTPERTSNRENGLLGKWGNEVITDDWSSTGLRDYIKRVTGK